MTESSDVKLRVFSRTPSSWDPQDDLLLRHLKEEQKLGWKEIASHFAHRTPNACQFRWRRLRSGSLKSATENNNNNNNNTAAVNNNNNNSSSASTPQTSSNKSSTSPSASPESVQSLAPTPTSRKTTAAPPPPNYTQWSFNSKKTKEDINPTDPLSASSAVPNITTSSTSTTTTPLSHEILITTPTEIEETSGLTWTPEEDELLLKRRQRSLSFTELSILLPTRTEGEILSRIDLLEQNTNLPAPVVKRSQSVDVKQIYSHTTPKRKSSRQYSVSLHTPMYKSLSLKERSFSQSFTVNPFPKHSQRQRSSTLVSSSNHHPNHHHHHHHHHQLPMRQQSAISMIKNRSNSFVSNDSIRSKSFSSLQSSNSIYQNLYSIRSNLFSEVRSTRKESISSIRSNLVNSNKTTNIENSKNPYDDDIDENAISDDDDDDDDDDNENYNNDLQKGRTTVYHDDVMKTRKLPSLGVLFNEYFTK